MSYCEFTKDLEETHPHKVYHDNFYGFPIEDDRELFGRLILEINQAGLNWLTVLKKENNFRKAFSNFDFAAVAKFGDKEIEVLMQDEGIIRNRKKIEAVIHNAGIICKLTQEFGSFKEWLDFHSKKDLDEWTQLFRNTFKFTGKLIVEEFLMSTGYIPGAHSVDCPIFIKSVNKEPKWKQN
ncbi:MAG: DNA-3-methyladenine glycosylase I [Brumimicrobium sp.]|nr:DNA-3-methyladenine glycosylase I [Brumimicrobium sp.]